MFKTLYFFNHFQNSPSKLWRVLESQLRLALEVMFSLVGIYKKKSQKHLFLFQRQVLGSEKKSSSKECFICRQDRDILQKLKMSKYSFRTGRNFISLAFSPLAKEKTEAKKKKGGIICHMTLCYGCRTGLCHQSSHGWPSGWQGGAGPRVPTHLLSCFQTAFLDSGSISFVPS